MGVGVMTAHYAPFDRGRRLELQKIHEEKFVIRWRFDDGTWGDSLGDIGIVAARPRLEDVEERQHWEATMGVVRAGLARLKDENGFYWNRRAKARAAYRAAQDALERMRR